MTKEGTSAEIVICISDESADRTVAVGNWILAELGHFFLTAGLSSYERGTPQNANRYTITTKVPTNILWAKVVEFAKAYCEDSGQDSIYFVDKKGVPHFIFYDGKTAKV